MTRIIYADRARLLELVHAHSAAVRRAAYAEEGSTAFGTREECRAVEDAAYGGVG